MFLGELVSGALQTATIDRMDVARMLHVVAISGVQTAGVNAWDFSRNGENKSKRRGNDLLFILLKTLFKFTFN